MTTSTIIFVFLSCLAVSTWSFEEGVSDVCHKILLHPEWSIVAIPDKCYGQQGVCSEYMKPGETKNGLTNPDHTFIQRPCSYEQHFYHCMIEENVTGNVSLTTAEYKFRTNSKPTAFGDFPKE
ncbi:uncharacterized protein [Venturia canescens]|uniref:uncharacterized protein n=1 Tax=Venturia canescens TaxID=32260 RepID=UPI001C9C5A85|nr:uncharacterized protein LOC122418630 [Venturia canescens]